MTNKLSERRYRAAVLIAVALAVVGALISLATGGSLLNLLAPVAVIALAVIPILFIRRDGQR